MGIAFAVMPVYIGEIAESDIRGCLGSSISVMYNMGVLLTYAIGPYVTIPQFAIISTSVPVLLFVTFMWVPESPYFLLATDQPQLAKDNLKILRRDKNIEKEFKHIQEAVAEQMKEKENSNILILLIKQKSNRKALLIMLGVRSVHQLCGMTSFIFYAEKIFGEAGGMLSSSTSAAIYALLQIVACFLSTVLLDRAGRKPLLIVSCVGQYSIHSTDIL